MKFEENYEKWLTSKLLKKGELEELTLIKDNKKEIEDRFYRELEFGTAGLRGKMGMGTNRMNRFVISRVSNALAKTIIESGKKEKGIVIAYDSRIHSKEFAKIAALVMASNGIKTYLFESLRPTPELSFAVRYLNTISGINITASHNPKEYNGYKVYWEEGSQIKSNISDKVLSYVKDMDVFSNYITITEEEAISKGLLEFIGKNVDEAFYKEVLLRTINDSNIDKNINIVYTPLNGAGYIPVTTILDRRGFKNVYIVEEQKEPDGTFPTLEYPNPENIAAFEYSEKLAKKVDADVILATDPDCDRLAVEVIHENKIVPINGNQTGAILVKYILDNLSKSEEKITKPYIVKSIVTSKMIEPLCKEYGIEVIDVLTGFKNIAEVVNKYEKTKEKYYVMGYEESIGYNVGTFLRDKDGVTISMLLVEIVAYYKNMGKTLIDVLEDFYKKYGYYSDKTISITYEGIEGAKKISRIMEKIRDVYPKKIGKFKIKMITDYLESKEIYIDSKKEKNIDIEKTNAIRFTYSDETWYTLRPSGTEPKIKLYIYTKGENKEETLEKICLVEKEIMSIFKDI